MAKATSVFDTLHDLTEQEVEKAAIQLADVRRGQQQAAEQLKMLLDYQDEYRSSLNTTMTSGITSTRWYNYQQFIKTLEQAIEQHRRQLAQWDQRVESGLNHWREKKQRLHAWETLQARAAATALAAENRLDQKRMDEFAQRATLRKNQ